MKKLKYVIQRHDASHLHYDLRLELDNVAKSWAVPREPTAEEGVKRLAVQVDDHELDYMDFEGEIPEGQYGAGKVRIWDSGTYNLIDRKDYKMIIDINGEKLKGKFVLVQMKGRQWLFFKAKET